jgi:NACalpha-BTF3-like transcription factor
MNNSTNNSFEEQWQKAFDDASLPPSDAVWEKIELGLGNDNIPPKPNNSSYYLGGAILTVVLGLGIWFFSHEKESIKSVQVIENKEVKQEEKTGNVVLENVEKVAVQPKEIQAIKKVIISKKEEVEVVVNEPEIIVQEPENQTRIIPDSIDFINPKISTKNMNTAFENPSLEIPFQAIPYYEKPIPKPKKKSIWDKVRISGGVGIYQ